MLLNALLVGSHSEHCVLTEGLTLSVEWAQRRVNRTVKRPLQAMSCEDQLRTGMFRREKGTMEITATF